MMHQNRERNCWARALIATVLAAVIGMTFYASTAPVVYATETATSEPVIEEESTDIVEGSQSEDVKPEDAKPDDDSAVTPVTAPPETEESIADDTTAKKKAKKSNETTVSEKKKKAEESESEVSAETTVQTTIATEAATTTVTTTTAATTTQATFQTTTTPAATTVTESEPVEKSESLTDDAEETSISETTTILAEEPEPEIIQLGDSKAYVSMDEYQQLVDRVADLEAKAAHHSAFWVGLVLSILLDIAFLMISANALARNDITANFETQYENLHDLMALFYTTACAIRETRKEQKSKTDDDREIDENLDELIARLEKALKKL